MLMMGTLRGRDVPEQPPSPLALVLKHLRIAAGWSSPQLAGALGLNKSLISAYERGAKPLTRGQLEALIAPLGYLPEAVDVLLTAHSLIRVEVHDQAPSPVALTPEEWRRMDRASLAAGCTACRVAAQSVRVEWGRGKKAVKLEAEKQKAESLFQKLGTLSRKERRWVIEAFPKFRNWALAVRVCEASLKRAAHKAEESLDLAELAVSIAERAPGEESWRSRLEGFCWAHVANARRVANDLAGADEAFRRAWGLWRQGADSDPDLLDGSLLPAMEASLRRAQRRFLEALELLDRARAECEGDPFAMGRILLNRERVLNQQGDIRGAFETLIEAAPYIEASGDSHLIFALRFNMAEDLCELQRLDEAEKLLPQVRELAIQEANELDLIRLVWLDSKVAAGQGRTEEAIAGLEQVRRDFTVRKQPYNAALSSLDLAVLWLKEGRTGKVKELALAMGWLFTAQGIAREALAALQLFCNAASQEAATVELARKVIADIEQVRRSAPSNEKGRDRG